MTTVEDPVEAPAAEPGLESDPALPSFPLPPPPTPPTGPPLLAVLAFWAFVLGGFAFGGVFLANWKAMQEQAQPVTVRVPVAGPISVGGPAGVALGPAPSGTPASSAVAVAPRTSAPAVSGLAGAAIKLLPEWKGTDPINIVLLGIDRRPEEPVDGTRSDTIIFVSIDPVGKSAVMVSLPRDMWVSIPGYGEQRINVAHAVGGPDLTKRTVTTDFGLPVQFYARVDFAGFRQMVDAVDGIIVDVDRPVKDDAYPTEDYGYQRIYVAPGPQWLDGPTALYYARSRHSENDFGRARRQQKVIVGVRDRVMQLNMLPKAPEMLGIVQKAVSTDLSPTDMLSLARLSSEIPPERIVNLVLDTNYVTPFVGADGADLLRPNYAAIRSAITRALKTASHPELQASVEVLNGSGRAGLGQQAADYLSAQGYAIDRIAVADRTDYTQSLVQVLTGNRQAGTAVASALGMAPTAVEDSPAAAPKTDLRIIIGQDFRVPASR